MEFFGYTNIAIVINPAPMEDAVALKCAIEKKIKESDTDILSLVSGMQSNGMIDPSLIKLIISLASDIEINKYIMACLERCTYNKAKITNRTFDSEDARKDYYKIAIECIKVNIWPFYEGLISEWTTKSPKIQAESRISL